MGLSVLALGPLPAAEMERLERQYNVIRLWKQSDPEKILHDEAANIRAVVSYAGGPGVSMKMMSALPNLEIVTQFGVGYDNIDVATAKTRQIAVTNTPDVLTNDTADTALALLLAVSRRITEGDMYVRTGKWDNGPLGLGHTLTGKTVGIVGLGRIGAAIAKRCAAFDMNVVYYSRTQKADAGYQYYADLVQMAGAVDILILAVSGGEGTKHLVGRKVLGAMKPKAYLINISRGSVVDEDALVAVLVNGKIGGAGLDVFAHEPDVPGELKAMDNVVLTPHIGSATIETRSKMGQLVIANLDAHFAGEPLLTPVT